MLFATQLKALLGAGFNFYLLAAVLAILATGVIASILADKKRTRRQESQERHATTESHLLQRSS
jgi:hypothetical protein